MGAWTHIAMRLPSELGRQVMPVSRPESSSPATGSHDRSEREQQQLLDAAFSDQS